MVDKSVHFKVLSNVQHITQMASTLSRPKLWTKHGLKILGILIRQAREERNWSLEDLSKQIHAATGEKFLKTIGNVENSVGEPKYNTLAAIAALRFIIDSTTGKALTEFDFIDIASETYCPFKAQKMRLKQIIDYAISLNELSEAEIYQNLQAMKARGFADLSLERLNLIRSGNILPSDDELRVIREIIDPDEQAFNENQWLEAAGLKSHSTYSNGS